MFFFKQHHQLGHPRTLRRYSEINHCCCKAKWKSLFRVRRDHSFRKRCTVHGVRTTPCDWGL